MPYLIDWSDPVAATVALGKLLDEHPVDRSDLAMIGPKSSAFFWIMARNRQHGDALTNDFDRTYQQVLTAMGRMLEEDARRN